MKTHGRVDSRGGLAWLVGLGLLMVAVGSFAAPPLVYKVVGVSVTDIGTLGGDWAVAWDINNRGHIVGMSKTSLAEDHAFFYKSGAMYDISPPFAAGGSEARAINYYDEVAANYGDVSYRVGDHAYRWEGGVAYPLTDTDPFGVPGRSRAWGISDRSLIAGQRIATSPANTAAVVWTSDTTYVQLSVAVAGDNSYARDVNSGGLIVGHQGSDHTPRRWRLLPFGIVVSDIAPSPLPVAMFSSGGLEGVNKSGAVAGQIQCCIGTPSVRRHAWTWNGVSAAGAHIGVLWPGGFSQGEDINNNGIVAGYAQRPAPPDPYSDEWDAAFLYHRDFGRYLLPRLSRVYHSCRASALNDLSSGVVQVVGVCLQELGKFRAVRWDVKVEQVPL
ncbi:MAG TPA: hypothetical protein VFS58_03395 [Steroidobacteraceae bacterium]|nr:hypothetical protein [Steroidobacteraceae bacterium]